MVGRGQKRSGTLDLAAAGSDHGLERHHRYGSLASNPQDQPKHGIYRQFGSGAQKKILWTFESSKPLLASPAVVDNRVYLSTEDGRTVALDRFTGVTVWEYQTGFPSSSTPAVAADLVFTVTRPGVVTALEQSTGAPRWEQDLHQPILASPMIADGTLYIGASDSNLYALDAATGQLRWSFDAADWITSGVAYLEGNLVVTSQDHNLRVVGAKSGRQRLVYDTGRGRSIAGGAAIQGDVAYFGTQHGRVWAVNRQARSYPFERGILFWRSTFGHQLLIREAGHTPSLKPVGSILIPGARLCREPEAFSALLTTSRGI